MVMVITKSQAELNTSTSLKKIWEKFRIKRGDNLPFRGWNGTRETLGEIFYELNFQVGAEIGVRSGEFSESLIQANPMLLKHYAIDPWAPYARTDQRRQDRYWRFCHQRLDKYPCAEMVRMTSMEAVQYFPDQSLDYVYIDGLHDFDNVMLDLLHWVPKVRIGGIISGHDFRPAYNQGIIYAVEAYTRAHNIQQWFVTAYDEPPSFVWVR